jgi:hypothetical protein
MKERNFLKNENGSVVVLALIILVLLTLMGMAVTRTTSIEVQVAANDEFSKIAFHNADSGTYVTPRLISFIVDEAMPITDITTPNRGTITYLIDPTGNNFFRQVMGYDLYDGGAPAALDIQFQLGTNPVQVDVQALGSQLIAGGSSQSHAGAEGMGAGSIGGIANFFNMDSFGSGPWNAQSNITANYRKVLGAAGLGGS